MKTRHLLISVALIVAAGFIFSVEKLNTGIRKYVPRTGVMTVDNYGIQGAMEWINKRKADPITGKVEITDVLQARHDVEASILRNRNKTTSLQWIEMGPDNVGGRTRAILVDKDNPNLIFAGSVAGGLWKSTTGGLSWVKVTDTNGSQFESLIISSIVQTKNGNLYFGTGEGFAGLVGSNSTSTGFYGAGIWKSTNKGDTWTHLTSTGSGTDSIAFTVIYELAACPVADDKIYAGTLKGIRISDDGGISWRNPLGAASMGCYDVKVASDGTVLMNYNNQCYISPTGDDFSFVNHSGGTGGLPTNVGRMEFAFSPDDPNYIYCLAAKSTPGGAFQNIYRSTNKGLNWTGMFAAAPPEYFSLFGSNNQGNYDNVIAVYPKDKESFLVGGIDLWKIKWTQTELIGPEQVSAWWLDESSSGYVHADQHAIVFAPDYNGTTKKTVYFGCDGGVSKSDDGGTNFTTLIRNYVTTQFYDIGMSGDGRVVGGTQDNGSQYLDFKGNTLKTAKKVGGGDGGGCALSALDPDILFSSVYKGDVTRSEDKGVSSAAFYSNNVTVNQQIGALNGYEPFVTPLALFENFNDPKNIDSIRYINNPKDTLLPGQTVTGRSKIHNRPVYYTLSDTLHPKDTIKMQDPHSAILAVALYRRIWVTRYPLDFTQQPPMWKPILILPSTPPAPTFSCISWSADGDILYAGDDAGGVYRISNISNARTGAQLDAQYTQCIVLSQKIGTFAPYVVTSVSVDPANAANVLITLGSYSGANHVYYSSNATDSLGASVAWSTRQGDLPKMPVYSSIIHYEGSKIAIIGTEYGIFSTDDITVSSPVWVPQNTDGMANVPVFALKQQVLPNLWGTDVTNHGFIYAGTHGRGIFRTESLKGPVSSEPLTINSARVDALQVYPNPVRDIANVSCMIPSNGPVVFNVYDLKGKLVKSFNYSSQTKGAHNYSFAVEGLGAGTYIINMVSGETRASTKFVVY